MDVLSGLGATAILALLLGVPALVAARDLRSGRRDPGLPPERS